MTAPLSEEYLAEVEARAAAATRGPWRRSGYSLAYLDPEDGEEIHLGYFDGPEADVAFMAGARTDVPALVTEVRRLRSVMADVQTRHAPPAARTVPAGVRELVGDLISRSGLGESCWIIPTPTRWALLVPREGGGLPYFIPSRRRQTVDEAVSLGLVRLGDALEPLPAHGAAPTWLVRTVSQPLEGYRISALGGAQ